MALKKYSTSYSDESFWKKISVMPETAGCSVLRAAYTLYALLREPTIPIWAKASIIGVLGYFIVPIDIVPDFLIGTGYMDDLALMTLVLGQLYAFINQDVRDRVELMLPEKCRRVFKIELTYKS